MNESRSFWTTRSARAPGSLMGSTNCGALAPFGTRHTWRIPSASSTGPPAAGACRVPDRVTPLYCSVSVHVLLGPFSQSGLSGLISVIEKFFWGCT